MWLYRFVLAIAGGSCLVILSAALTRTAASVAPVSFGFTTSAETSVVSLAPAPLPSAEATRCIEQALDALKADRVSWLETAIWQKVQLPAYSYEAEGSYRLAPGQRFRLEMHTHLGEAEGTLLMVSDGRDMWEGTRPGQGAWEGVTRLRLAEVFSTMNGPAGPQLRDEFLQRPHFQGMTPLLRSLRDRLVWARSEVTHRASGDQIHLVGVWAKEEAAKLAPAEATWPTSLPRQCHLYLDAQTHWLQRVEWWGPTAAKGADHLLVQMEFRNPVFNRPLAADVCARLFAFQPGDASIEDETASVTAEMTKRAGELAQNTTH
ncbi:MAG TPA: hypothetical protein VN688_31765 [Gemmataceae bacterium]|nr:hypothetical protein [Gemmataceae bacterium]